MTEELLKVMHDDQLKSYRYLMGGDFENIPNKAAALSLLDNLPLMEKQMFSNWTMVADPNVLNRDWIFRGNFHECTFCFCEFDNIIFLGDFSSCEFDTCSFHNCVFGKGIGSEGFPVDFSYTYFTNCTVDDCIAINASFRSVGFIASKVFFNNVSICSFYRSDMWGNSVMKIGKAHDTIFTRMTVSDNSMFDIEEHDGCGLDTVCPETGEFIAYKKILTWSLSDWPSYDGVRQVIAKLIIPASAQRSSALSRKCRASEAVVAGFYECGTGEPLSDEYIKTHNFGSIHSMHFFYRLGEKVVPDSYDTNRWHECTNGIHFFMTFKEASNY